jgi:hypothetical protein
MLITDRFSSYVWDYYFIGERTQAKIIKHLHHYVTMMERQYNAKLQVVECDNEIIKTYGFKKREACLWLEEQGIRLEPSAPNTQAQNGGAERSGAMIKEKARCNRIDAHLPRNMWPEITRATVYLYNRTPIAKNNWKSPYKRFHTHIGFQNGTITAPIKPNLSHLVAYGSKAYAVTTHTQLGQMREQRLDAKAWIGYHVGYRSSNIYVVWIPSLGKVIDTRDVAFDEDKVFSGDSKDLMDDLMHNTVQEIKQMVQDVQLYTRTNTGEIEEDLSVPDHEEDEPSIGQEGSRPTREQRNMRRQARKDEEATKNLPNAYPTPPTSPPAPAALLVQLFDELRMEDRQFSQPTAKTVPWKAAFMAGMSTMRKGRPGDGRLYNESNRAKLLQRLANKKTRVHRDELPEPPRGHGSYSSHPLYKHFKEAERVHLQSHQGMHSWEEAEAALVRREGQQVLDCMWVYTYKFDKHHLLDKCKARLVVRGDQQRNITSQDTYAATLASKSFRLLLSIAAKKDLELKQYDVSNAFVHASIDREIYMRMPPGYHVPGKLLRVKKALYGLRISPLLWQKDFTKGLKDLGFSEVPHEPCCMVKDGIIVFFYVDDIIVAYHPDKQTEAQQAVKELQEKYQMTGGHDLQWFLGVEIIRDRAKKLIHLSQAQYIDKISRLIDKQGLRHDTPMGAAELLPYERVALYSEINRYQRKIGSLLFAAVTTRPDVAFATSRLARFLSNPSTEHHDAADRVLLYLKSTQHYVLTLGGGDTMIVMSDASFADNTQDRRSSQGYVILLFGGLISWRASKQDTVTTSTTEAELLALSQVAKEAMFTVRLLAELKVHLPQTAITIQCDNQQTIRLINEDTARLTTKLRHVNIHNHWLREKRADGTITVQYVPTADMLADGLTKALPIGKWNAFLNQLRLHPRKDRKEV